jgi:hypothetical protein
MNRRQISGLSGIRDQPGIGDQGRGAASRTKVKRTPPSVPGDSGWTLDVFGASDCRVGFVMHADFKRLFLTELFGQGALRKANWDGIYNTAVTQLEVHIDEPQLDVFNSIVHLPDDLVSR